MDAGKILVTGGAGYIGAHTAVQLISAGYDVIIVDNLSKSNRSLLKGIEIITGKPVQFFQGDCCDKKFLQQVFKENAFQTVLHFAAFKSVGESVKEPLSYYRNNIDSLLSILEVMKEFGVEDLIFSSSCTVYGQPDSVPVDEAAPFKNAESPYGSTKQMCERILHDVYSTGYRIISLRYFNPVGAHPSAKIGELPIGVPGNLVPYITQTAAGKRSFLTVFGGDYATPDGSCIRDYIHVMDVADAHVRASEFLRTSVQGNAPFYEAFNLGTGVGMSVLEVVNMFKEISKVDLKFHIGPRRPGDVEKVFADPRKVNDAFKWKTKFSMEQALEHAWTWERTLI